MSELEFNVGDKVLLSPDSTSDVRAIDDNHKEVVLSYEPDSEYPFRTDDEIWRYAVPVEAALRED